MKSLLTAQMDRENIVIALNMKFIFISLLKKSIFIIYLLYMLLKSKILLTLFLPAFLSCTTVDLQRKVIPPLKSYVKVYHSIKISKCTEKYKDSCPIGEYHSMGSGMLVKIIENEKIVITAGHVCDSEVDMQKISSSIQSVSVVDFRGIKHNARIIKSSQDNGKGAVDMCALWVPTLLGKGVKFSSFRPKPGQELYYVGSPAGIYQDRKSVV